MSETDEMNAVMESEMGALSEEQFIRPGCAFDIYEKYFSKLLAQTEKDRAPLTAAGFRYEEKMPKYVAYHEKLALEHGQRVNAESAVSKAAKVFREGIPQAKQDKKVLMAAGRYVVARSETPEPKRVYDQVRKGYGHVDLLNDNIAMVAFCRTYAGLVSEVRPGGITIDEAFLERVESEAVSLLKRHGEAAAATDEESYRVDRQRRLLTLCILAERDIKLFADAAYYDDTDYYNDNYARPDKSSDSNDSPEEPPAENAAETA